MGEGFVLVLVLILICVLKDEPGEAERVTYGQLLEMVGSEWI